MEFQNIQLPSSVYPVSDEVVTSGGVVYFLLSNDTILRFDIYSEEHILIFAPSIINDFRPYASRLIKFHGKLGYFSVRNMIEYVVPAHPSQQVFSIRSDFDKVSMPSRY
uniref:Uncharacterized protein n=1 Tax=Lactuca sativa TaxID=4236 RepID=A0A9R1UT83_LACSA|nr:hypothetical protein LSAT_V11C800452330 [Lactuca sativa]